MKQWNINDFIELKCEIGSNLFYRLVLRHKDKYLQKRIIHIQKL